MVTIGLDGKQAINNILWSKIDAANANFDMIIQIKAMTRQLPLSINWLWI